ncbi:hypothetical protein RF55_26507 [Lasius niger]|uniref:Uncharacterized protein n=1 Tax=Lasius niger TaxID=67767 RepID=A0A0J7JT48_LASNI|nr:hypothetical protein RF55_26507 [Lasius niger]
MDLGRVKEPQHGLHHHVDAHGEQHERLECGGEHLGTLITPGLGRGGRLELERERRGEQRHSQAHGVSEHVSGVDHEGEAAREYGRGELHHHEPRNQDKDRDKPAPRRAFAVVMMLPQLCRPS